jgi:uncharacterized protein (DUF1778 family)
MDKTLWIRCTAAQKDEILKAANAAGLDYSSWLRAVALRAARSGSTGVENTTHQEEKKNA